MESDKVERTFEWWQEFVGYANAYMERQKDKKNKVTYAIGKVGKQLLKAQQQLAEKRAILMEDINIKYCMTDPALGFILMSPTGNYQFLPESQTKRLVEQREAVKKLMQETFAVEPCFATALAPDLNEDELEIFAGVVIRQEEADARRDKLLAELEK